jgi:site-specific recombinase XerD
MRIFRMKVESSNQSMGAISMIHVRGFDRVVDDAKVSNFTLHALRHTFISRLVMAGVDLRTAQELAGTRRSG